MRIKAKSGYTVNITDINISLQNNRDFIEVNDDTFNNSIDAKKLMKYIEIDNGTVNVASTQPNKEKVANATVHATEVIPNTFVITEAVTEKQTNSIVFDPNNEANLNVVKTINTVTTHKAKQQDTNDTSQNVAADIKIELEPQQTNILHHDTKSAQANTSSNTTNVETNDVSNTVELNTTAVNTSQVNSSKTNEAKNSTNTESNTNIISESADNKSTAVIDTKSEKKKSKKK